jgi:hypothetical protein
MATIGLAGGLLLPATPSYAANRQLTGAQPAGGHPSDGQSSDGQSSDGQPSGSRPAGGVLGDLLGPNGGAVPNGVHSGVGDLGGIDLDRVDLGPLGGPTDGRRRSALPSAGRSAATDPTGRGAAGSGGLPGAQTGGAAQLAGPGHALSATPATIGQLPPTGGPGLPLGELGNLPDLLPTDLFGGALLPDGRSSALLGDAGPAPHPELFDGGLPLLGGLAGALPVNTDAVPASATDTAPDTAFRDGTGLPAGGAPTAVTGAGDRPDAPGAADGRPAHRGFSDGRPVAGDDTDFN